MRLKSLVPLLVFVPLAALANPVSIDGQSAIAFGIVGLCALVVESGVVALTLLPTGIFLVPCFVVLTLANIAVFVFAFLPLTSQVSLWILEPGVVVVDAVCIKLLTEAPFLQSGDFVGVTWSRALVASLIGNTVSFFVGVLASGAPWVDHGTYS